jgi:hypothetical protein
VSHGVDIVLQRLKISCTLCELEWSSVDYLLLMGAGCGGLIRDSIYGCLECGFSKIWGVVEGLQLVWTCGLRL